MEKFPSSCLRLCLTFQTFRAYGVSRRQSRAPCSPPPLLLSPAPRFWGTEARKVRKGAEFLGNGEFWKQQLWMKHQRVLLPGAFPSWEQGMGGMGMGKQLMGCLCSERCVLRDLFALGALHPEQLPYREKLAITQPSLIPFQSPNKPAPGFILFVRDHLLINSKCLYRKISN